MSANPHANGGALLKTLAMPHYHDSRHPHARRRVTVKGEATRNLGKFLRDVMKLNLQNFRLFGPDETASNRLEAVYEASPKAWMAEREWNDDRIWPRTAG